MELGRANVSAVVDVDPKKLELVARRFPTIKTSTNFQDLLRDPSIDAIAVATPVQTHFELGMAVLKAGKHLWLEKPMTESSLQARKLVDEAEKRKRVLLVDHTFVYTGAVRKMGEIIESGDLGRVYYYDLIRVNLGLFQHDVSVISDLAVHDFSILDYLLKEHPVAVSASGINHFPGTPENLAYITLFYNSGTIAHTNVSWLAPVKVRQILLGGSKKMITYDDFEPSEKVKVYDKGVSFTDDPRQIYEMRVGYRTGDMWAPKIDGTEALRVEGEHFLDCIEGGKVTANRRAPRPPCRGTSRGCRQLNAWPRRNRSPAAPRELCLIPFVDLKAQYASIKPEVDAAILGVLESCQFTLGSEVEKFEEEFAAYCSVKLGVGVNSGTSALHLALLAAGIGPGDEVITVPFTFVATVAAIHYAGASPVFVDIDPETFTMDPAKLESAITPRTRAILPVHLYGQPADMDPILDVGQEARPDRHRGCRSGSWRRIQGAPGREAWATWDASASIPARTSGPTAKAEW